MMTDEFATRFEDDGIEFVDGDVVSFVYAETGYAWARIRWHVDHENRRNYYTAFIKGYPNEETFVTKDEAANYARLVINLTKENQND